MTSRSRAPGLRALAGALPLLLLLLLPGTTVGQESDVARGASVYGSMCGRCHNPRSPLERDDRAWVTIANHMRVRGNLTGRQVRQVLAFLQATNMDPRAPQTLMGAQEEPGVPPDSDAVARGEALVNRNACLGCHVIQGNGGSVGPNLTCVVRRRDATFIRRKLADPTFNNEASMMPNFGLTEAQIEAIVAYLTSRCRT